MRSYLFSDRARGVQTVLGLIWLLDGGLQFQSFMYSHGFLAMIRSGAAGQPGWAHDSILWGARIAGHDLTLWNTLFALTQVALGVGLLVRPLVRPTLVAMFGWVLVVWWFGEGFGGLLTNAAQPLTGAPGGVLLYGLVGLVAWPSPRPGGLLGPRGARTMWAALWLLMTYLWLLAASSSANATKAMLTSIPSGIHILTRLQTSLAGDAAGHGLPIALALAAVSAVIAVAVAFDTGSWPATGQNAGRPARVALAVSIVLNLAYWIVPQALGGIFAGGATDPNAGPLFVLLAVAMLPVVDGEEEAQRARVSTVTTGRVARQPS